MSHYTERNNSLFKVQFCESNKLRLTKIVVIDIYKNINRRNIHATRCLTTIIILSALVAINDYKSQDLGAATLLIKQNKTKQNTQVTRTWQNMNRKM